MRRWPGWSARPATSAAARTVAPPADVRSGGEWGTRRLPGGGFVAARFRHRTSRAGDPQLHWHVLVANMTRGSGRAVVGVGRDRVVPVAAGGGGGVPGGVARELTERLGVSGRRPGGRRRRDRRASRSGCCGCSRSAGSRSKPNSTASARRDREAAEAATLATRRRQGTGGRDRVDAPAGWPRPRGSGGDRASSTRSSPTRSARRRAGGGRRAVGASRSARPAGGPRRDVHPPPGHRRRRRVSSPAGPTRGGRRARPPRCWPTREIVPVHRSRLSGGGAGWEERFTTRRLLGLETAVTAIVAAASTPAVGCPARRC